MGDIKRFIGQYELAKKLRRLGNIQLEQDFKEDKKCSPMHIGKKETKPTEIRLNIDGYECKVWKHKNNSFYLNTAFLSDEYSRENI